MNIVNESDPFNILLGDTYFHPKPSQIHNVSTNKQVEPILAVESSGRFTGLQYSRRNNDQAQASSFDGNPSQGKDNPQVQLEGKHKSKPKGNDSALDVHMGNVLAKFNVQVHLIEMAKFLTQRKQISKAFGFEYEPYDLPVIF